MCEHTRTRPIVDVTKAPLKDGHHTAFMLMNCVDCGALVGFPQENFELAINEGTEDVLRNLLKRAARIKI